jgi:N,N'-diacetyllegionaminate synthase
LNKKNKTFIIAEVGVNHNGSIAAAKKLVKIAKDSGADAVKFQTFELENLLTKKVKKAGYQKKNLGNSDSQYDMLSKLVLSESDFVKIKKYCNEVGIEFMSTAFDILSAKFLKQIKVKKIKIASGEITNLPLLRYLGSQKKKIILSTGMSTMKEVKDALRILISSGTKKSDITALHCTTDYPASMGDVNLLAMLSLKKQLNIKVGYSDHTLGIEVSIAAVALGASVIEKHITLSKMQQGPDHKSSLEPEELKKLVSSIRNIDQALGSGLKNPTIEELKNQSVIRKYIVAAVSIKKGEKFSKLNLTTKRSKRGLSPMMIENIIGKKAKTNFKVNQNITI